MFPNLQLDEPKGGDRISATTIRNLVKSVKSLQPTVGWGMMISKTPQGVMYQLDKSVIQRVSKVKMPFDGSLDEQTGDSSTIVVRVLKGSLYYGLGTTYGEVTPTQLQDDYWRVGVTLAEGVMIGIVCDYSDNAVGEGPESFHVDIIPSIGSQNYENWVDEVGLHYYPLIRFVDGTAGYEGPYIFSVNASVGGETKTFYAVQSHHGDVFFDFNVDLPFVAEILSGNNGRYSINVVDASGTASGYINVVELATAATFPSGSRVIGHPIYANVLASGDAPSSSSSES